MKKRYSKKHSSKLNIFLVIAALLALVITAITVSYSWIESSNSIAINSGAGNTISVKTDNPCVAQIAAGNGDPVNLSQYIDNPGSLFLAPAKLDDSGNLTIKRASGEYTTATTNDIGNNFIEFDVPFTVVGRYKFSFTGDSKISVADSTSNPIRTSLKVDDRDAIVFDSILNNVGTSDRSAFSVQAGSHTLKVRIWLDASTTENETAAESIKGKTVDISLKLVPEIDASLRKVTISEAAHADVTATYNNGTTDVTLKEGDSATLEPGTVITVIVKTADGIVKGSNSALNGYMFKNISTDVAGSSTVLTSTVGSTDGSHIATTTYVYQVPDDGSTEEIIINTNTQEETFYIIGPGINENSNWSSPNNTTTLNNYDSVNNCVYGVFTAVGTGNEFKISEKTDNGGTNVGRDSPKYSVSLNSPTVIKSGNITEAKLNSQSSPNTNFTYKTSSSGEKILVIYYLSDNTVEIASGGTYVAEYTATAKVSTANSNGTATVTYGNTAGESVKVPRRADNKEVTFKAEPIAGYAFVGWSTSYGGTTYESTEAEYPTTLTGDLTLYANFKQVHTLTVMPLKDTATDNALITATATLNSTTTNVSFTDASELENTGTASIIHGSNVTLTASLPHLSHDNSKTYKVVWLEGASTLKTDTIGDGYAATSSYTIDVMNAPHNITVQYIPLYKLEVTKTGVAEGDDSKATVSAVIKESAGEPYPLENGVAYVPAGTAVTVTANVAANGNPYRVSSADLVLDGISSDLIPTSDAPASCSFSPITINTDKTIEIKFERLYKLTYGLVESVEVATIAAAAKESGAENFSQLTSSPAYLPKNTEVKFTVNPSGENYTQLYKINSATQYTYGAVPDQTITADMNVEVRVIQNQTVTITVPSSDVATLTAKYTFPNAPEQILDIKNTEGDQVFKVPQGATVTVKTTIKDSKDKFNGYTVSGSTSYTEDIDNKSVDVEVQNSDITIAPNIAIMDVAECPQEILNNTNVSFYAGNKWSGDYTYYYSSSDTTRKQIDTSYRTSDGINYGFVTGTDLKGVPSEAYSLTNASDGWGGVPMDSTAEGGWFYYLNSASLGSGNRIDKIAATTATTTLSASEVEPNAKGVTVTTGSFSRDTTAIGTQFYVQHFIKKSTDTDYTFLATSQKITATDNTFVTDISKYAETEGTYEIKTVLTDGKVYYLVGDTKTLNVVEKFDVKVYSATNADLEVKNGSETLGTINAGADPQTFRVPKGTSVSITATPTVSTGKYKFTWTDSSNAGEPDPDPEASPYTDTSKYTISSIANDADISVTLEHYYALTVELEGTGSYTVDRGEAQTATSTTYIKADDSSTITATRTGTDPYKVSWTATGSQTDSQSAELIGDTTINVYTVSEIRADTKVTLKFVRLYKVTYNSAIISITSPAPVTTDTSSSNYIAYYVSGTNNITFASINEVDGQQYSYAWLATYEAGGNASGTNSTFVLTSPNGLTDNVKVTLNRTEIQGRTINLNNSAHAKVVATYGDTATVLNDGDNIPINAKIYMTVTTADGAIKSVDNTNRINGYRFDGIYIDGSPLKTETKTARRTENDPSATNIATTTIKNDDGTDYYTVTAGTDPITIETKTTEEQYFICGEKFNGYSGNWSELAEMTRGTGDTANIVSADITANSSDSDLKFKIAITDTANTTSSARRDDRQYCVNYSSPAVSGGDGSNLLQITSDKFVNLYFRATAGKVYTVEYNIDTNTVTVTPKADTPSTGITVYFENTLNWSNVYVNFYSGSYWNTTYGTGSMNITSAANQMTRIAGTNIYQFTYSGSYSTYISFTKDAQAGNEFFYQTSVVYRSDFSVDKPLFIPDTKSNETKNQSAYYSDGVWSAYPNTKVSNSTRYYLKGSFNGWNDTNEMVSPSSGSKLVEVTVSLNAGNYGFKIHGDKWYSNGVNVSDNATYVQFYENKGDSTFKATEDGKYKFIYNTTTNCLTVVKIPD